MIGQTISHYRIIEKLGEGGMGVVYKAEDIKLKRVVALKFLPPQLTSDEETKKRFIHEAQTASALEHINICNIHEIDETDDGQLFISMAFYEGESLKNKIEGERLLSINLILDIAIQTAQGLKIAHESKIIHRDLKPANIMITDRGEVKIVDFGLAKLAGQTKLTKEGSTLGTIAYMSPEQARGETLDQRSDIWSLGVILYEMITGQLPFKGDYDQAVIYSINNEEPEPLTGIRKNISLELERIVNRALCKTPEDRYQHVDDMLSELNRLRKDSESSVVTKKIIDSKRSFKSVYFPLVILSAIILIIVGYLIILPGDPENAETTISKWENSIAVLPFRDFSPKKDQDHFCFGMTDAINDRLTQLGKLKVISTTSVMRYKDTEKDIKVIGNELGVINILEGSVQIEGDKIRVTGQLINAQTGFHLWSETFEKKLESIFDVQDEVSQAIAEALKVKFASVGVRTPEVDRPESMEAYEYYLKGMNFFASRYLISNQEKDFQSSVNMFEKALQIDHNYALAHVGLAWAYIHHWIYTGDLKNLKFFKKHGEAAYQLDPTLSPTNAIKGIIYSFEHDYDKTFELFRISLKINPNISEINFEIGVIFNHIGLYHHAIKYFTRARELDPFYILSLDGLGGCYYNLGEFEKATVFFEKVLEMNPNEPIASEYYALTGIMLKRYDLTEKMLTEWKNIDPQSEWVRKTEALLFAAKGNKERALSVYKDETIYAMLGMKDEAIEYISERYEKPRKYPYLSLISLPIYDVLSDNIQFQKILNKQKLKYEELINKYGDL